MQQATGLGAATEARKRTGVASEEQRGVERALHHQKVWCTKLMNVVLCVPMGRSSLVGHVQPIVEPVGVGVLWNPLPQLGDQRDHWTFCDLCLLYLRQRCSVLVPPNLLVLPFEANSVFDSEKSSAHNRARTCDLRLIRPTL